MAAASTVGTSSHAGNGLDAARCGADPEVAGPVVGSGEAMDVAGGCASPTGDDAGAPPGPPSSPHAAKRSNGPTTAIRRRAMDV